LADVLKKHLRPDEPFPVVVVCPPHLVEKWPREIAQIVPLARGHPIRRVSDFEDYVRKVEGMGAHSLQIAVVPTTMLKLGSGWTPAVVRQRGRHKRLVETRRGGEIVNEIQRQDTFACPRCGGTIYHRDEAGVPDYPITDESYFEGRRLTCDNLVKKWVGNPEGHGGHWEEVPCGEPLYQEWRGHWPEPERDGFGQLLPLPEPRYPIARYIKKKHDRLFELAIVDEIHEMKAQSSDRGHAFGVLAGASKRTLGMTGTLFGGMATSLFYLLHRLDHRIRHEFSWSDGHRFAALYGVLERVTRRQSDRRDHDDYGHYTGLRRERTRTVERPGISPALVTRLLDTTVFLTLEDLGFDLPSYTEQPVTIAMPNGRGSHPNMAGAYRRLERQLRDAAREDWSLMGEYLQTTLCWPNAPWRDEETTVGTFRGLPCDHVYPKERWLIETCQAERDQGRRVLVYLRQTGTRDIQPRIETILTEAGLHVATLRSSVSTTRREGWLKRRVRGGLDVLLANPRLVSTGLDLIDFPTLVFYEPEYSIYLIQQASRRSWRLGQTRPVKVYFAVYADTIEHRAVSHVGRKIIAAALLYGDDVAGALVDQAGAGGNLLEELAREVASNAEVPDLGEMFVQEHQKAEGAGWLLGGGAIDTSTELSASLTDRQTDEDRSNDRRQEVVDPSQVNQLRMF
ncbi:MAG: helicase-related protein, partial [Anaerolineae bacterium]